MKDGGRTEGRKDGRMEGRKGERTNEFIVVCLSLFGQPRMTAAAAPHARGTMWRHDALRCRPFRNSELREVCRDITRHRWRKMAIYSRQPVLCCQQNMSHILIQSIHECAVQCHTTKGNNGFEKKEKKKRVDHEIAKHIRPRRHWTE